MPPGSLVHVGKKKAERTTINILAYDEHQLQAQTEATVLVLYAHLIPALRSMGTALLTGVSVVSVIIGLAAQNTLGNLIAGISLLLPYTNVVLKERS